VLRVILIDDHEIFRMGLRALLEASDDIEVIGEAADGESGLKLVTEKLPDAIILDYAMPGISGLDIINSIKQRFSAIKLVLLTASMSESVLAEALNSGAHGLILKKDSSEELVEALHSIAHGGQQVISSNIEPLVRRFDMLSELTKRERQVLRMIAKGYRNREISDVLNVSIKTIDTHRTNLMRKLSLHNLVDVVEFANKTGLNNPYI